MGSTHWALISSLYIIVHAICICAQISVEISDGHYSLVIDSLYMCMYILDVYLCSFQWRFQIGNTH